MYHLVYTSTASIGLTEVELRQQLGHWRTTNANLHITGLLLYSTDGNIMQVLEGDASVVHALYASIAADVRHHNIVKLADGPVTERAFADWSMQFRSVGPADFSRLMPRPHAIPEHVRNLMPLLEAFMAEQSLD